MGWSGKIDWKSVKKIVVLNFITVTIGDALYTLPFVQRLKKEAPQAEIYLTGSSITHQVIGDDAAVTKFIELPDLQKLGAKESPLKKARTLNKVFWTAIKEVRRIKPDLALVLLPNLPVYQLIPMFSDVKLRFGFSYPGSFRHVLTGTTPFRNFEVDPKYVNVHFSEANLDLLKYLGLKITKKDWTLKRKVSKKERTEAKKIFKQYKLKKKLVAFQIGAKYKHRQWPTKRFVEVGKALVKKGATILCVGSPSEFDICEEVRKGIGKDCINLAGKTSFGSLAGVLEQCDMAVGNDSGLMHFAAGVGAKPVSLFGSPHPNHSRPRGVKPSVIITPPSWHPGAQTEKENRNVLSKYLSDIDAKTVTEVCIKTLAGKPPKNRWTE